MIRCKWIFRRKYNADGTLKKYKGRLAACGYSQELGVDYFVTFSPTVTLYAIRISLAIAIDCKWHLHSIDVRTTFLHALLDDVECYMAVPPGL